MFVLWENSRIPKVLSKLSDLLRVAKILLFYILWTTRSITIKCCASIINTLAGTLLQNHNRFKLFLKEHSSSHALAFPCKSKDNADKDPCYHTKISIFSFTWADLAPFHKSDKIYWRLFKVKLLTCKNRTTCLALKTVVHFTVWG